MKSPSKWVLGVVVVASAAALIVWAGNGSERSRPELELEQPAQVGSSPESTRVDAPAPTGRSAVPAETDAKTVAGQEADAQAPDDPPEPDEILEEGWYDHPEMLAAIGLSPKTPCALLIGRYGPPDPIETGEASLFLELFEGQTGEPAASHIYLWRLDAPGNEYWLPGDQAIQRVHVPEEGRTFEGLTAGRYRVVCDAERAGTPYSTPFAIAGRTDQALFLNMAGERPVRLELTLNGKRVEQADMLPRPVVQRQDPPRAPDWVRWREMRNPPDEMEISDYSVSEGDPSQPQWRSMLAGPDGFDLGKLPEDSRTTRYSRVVHVRATGAREGEITIRNDVAQDGTSAASDVLRRSVELIAN